MSKALVEGIGGIGLHYRTKNKEPEEPENGTMFASGPPSVGWPKPCLIRAPLLASSARTPFQGVGCSVSWKWPHRRRRVNLEEGQTAVGGARCDSLPAPCLTNNGGSDKRHWVSDMAERKLPKMPPCLNCFPLPGASRQLGLQTEPIACSNCWSSLHGHADFGVWVNRLPEQAQLGLLGVWHGPSGGLN